MVVAGIPKACTPVWVMCGCVVCCVMVIGRAQFIPFEEAASGMPDVPTHDVAFADLDGDTDPDCFVAAAGGAASGVWLNDGNGLFSAAWTLPASSEVLAAALKDMNGDWREDAVMLMADATVVVMLNVGDGSLAPGGAPVQVTGAKDIAVADVDADGDLDAVVAVGGPAPGANRILTNDGAGNLALDVQQLGNADTRSVALADLDADADNDLVAVGDGENEIWLNQGDGQFLQAAGALGTGDSTGAALADFDSDGDVDAFVVKAGASMEVWLNDGTGTFSLSPQSFPSVAATGVATADFNRDGDTDVAVAIADATPQVWLNDGTATFTALPHDFGSADSPAVALVDVDSDGDTDLFLADRGGGDQLWRNRSNGRTTTFDAGHLIADGLSDVDHVVTADLDGDGDRDVVVVSSQGNEILFSANEGEGVFAEPVTLCTPDTPRFVATGDIDRDGDIDLMTVNRGRQTSWYENPGTTTRNGPNWTEYAIGNVSLLDLGARGVLVDIDDDGDLDAIVPSHFREIMLYRNDGTPGNGKWPQEKIADDVTVNAVSVADLDGDSDLDVIASDRWEASGVWYENPGAVSPSTWTAHLLAADNSSQLKVQTPLIGIDWDRDGDIDIAGVFREERENYAGTVFVWLENKGENGSGGRQWSLNRFFGEQHGTPYEVAFADLNRDGWQDAVLTRSSWDNEIDGTVSAILQDPYAESGSPAWYERDLPTVVSSEFLALADIDGDGATDVVAGEPGDPGAAVRWYRGRPRHLICERAESGNVLLEQGRMSLVAALDFTHFGPADGAGLDVRGLRLQFQNGDLTNMASADLEALATDIHIYLDDGSGSFDARFDNRVATLPVSLDNNGVAEFDLPSMLGSSRTDGLVLPAGGKYRLLIVLDATPDAVSRTPDQFKMSILSFNSEELALADGQDLLFEEFRLNQRNHVHAAHSVTVPFTPHSPFQFGNYQFDVNVTTMDLPDLDFDDYADILVGVQAYELAGFGSVAGVGYMEILDGGREELGEPVPVGLLADVESVAAADFDLDGDPDVLAVSNSQSMVVWFESTPDPPLLWSFHTIDLAFENARAARPVDIDLDGDMDVAGVADDKLGWWENDGTGLGWQWHAVGDTDGGHDLAAGDIDRDGDPDLVVVHQEQGAVRWFENDRTTRGWSIHSVDLAFAGAANVRLADCDRDGKLDIVAVSEELGDLCWWRNEDAAQSWHKHVIEGDYPGLNTLATADWGQDLDLDYFGGAFPDRQESPFWTNNVIHRSARFPERAHIPATAARVTAMVTADFDRDGKPELVTADAGTGRLTLLQEDWGSLRIDAGVPELNILLACDVDLDGDQDLLGMETGSGTVCAWENRSPDRWVPRTVREPGGYDIVHAILNDFDRDGDQDLVLAEPRPGRVRWLENPRGFDAWTSHIVDDDFPGVTSVCVGDMNQDNVRDVVGASPQQGAIVWWEEGSPRGWIRHNFADTLPGVRHAELANTRGAIGDLRMSLLAFVQDPEPPYIARLLSWRQKVKIVLEPPAGFVEVVEWTGPEELWRRDGLSVEKVWAFDVNSNYVADVVGLGTGFDGLFWIGNDRWGDAAGWADHAQPAARNGRQTAAVFADLDIDGKLDLVLAENNGADLTYWPNKGGQFGLVTGDLAPPAAAAGDRVPLLRIAVHHRGANGDNALELAVLVARLETSAGQPLTTEEANRIIESLAVWLDDGSGTFDPNDRRILEIGELDLGNGRQALFLPDHWPGCNVPAMRHRTFFLVADLTPEAGSVTPTEFRVTHCTDARATRTETLPVVSRAEEWEYDVPLDMEFTPDTTTRTVVLAHPNGPQVNIITPTELPIYESDGTPVTISGIAAAVSGYIAEVAYHMLGTVTHSGTASGAETWALPETAFVGDGTDIYVIARDSLDRAGFARLRIDGVPLVAFATPRTHADELTGVVQIPIVADRPMSAIASVEVGLADGNGSPRSEDIVLPSGPVTFAAGQQTSMLEVSILNDDEPEPTESFDITLRNPQGAGLGANHIHTVVLNDEDTDEDTMSDDWERDRGEFPDYNGRQDWDGDGPSDGNEVRMGTDPFAYEVDLTDGWNLFSIARQPDYNLIAMRVPGAIPGPVWSWLGRAYGLAQDIFSTRGHWVYLPFPDSAAFTVTVPPPGPGETPDSPSVVINPGWNLVSIPRERTENAVRDIFADLVPRPVPPFWGWNGTSFVEIYRLSAFDAVWIYYDGSGAKQIEIPAAGRSSPADGE